MVRESKQYLSNVTNHVYQKWVDILLTSAKICHILTIFDILRTISWDIKTKQPTPFFSSTFKALTVCNISFYFWKCTKFHFMGSPLCWCLGQSGPKNLAHATLPDHPPPIFASPMLLTNEHSKNFSLKKWYLPHNSSGYRGLNFYMYGIFIGKLLMMEAFNLKPDFGKIIIKS